MTEAEWLACADRLPMQHHLGIRMERRRKARLYAVACCQRILHLLIDQRSRNAVTASEQYADREIRMQQLKEIAETASQVIRDLQAIQATREQFFAADAACRAAANTHVWRAAVCACSAAGCDSVEDAIQADLIRDIFGNPFRPVTFNPAWLTSDAISLARQIYESRDFSAMPILADALQDAGCDNPDVLNHCRGDGAHVRGCWVVDLVLGKS